MKKVLIVIAVVLLLALGAMGGFLWYRNTHVFVEDAVYPKNAQELDLQGTGISIEHYEMLQAQLPQCRILWDVPFQGGELPILVDVVLRPGAPVGVLFFCYSSFILPIQGCRLCRERFGTGLMP